MFVTIINDCRDENARGRQMTRVAALFSTPPSFVGVGSDLEAAGNVLDMLDAGEGSKGVVLANIAPRAARLGRENGSPFGYFWYGKTLVVSTTDGLTLSFTKKFRVTDTIALVAVDEVLNALERAQCLESVERERLSVTQFRSLELFPRLAAYLLGGGEVRSTPLATSVIPDAPRACWYVDNFGNVKTTLTIDDLPAGFTGDFMTVYGALPCVRRLKDVPAGEVAITEGSSGLREKRFLEIVVGGGSAAERFGITSGAIVV